jgi:hypothetical protein
MLKTSANHAHNALTGPHLMRAPEIPRGLVCRLEPGASAPPSARQSLIDQRGFR